MTVKILIAKLIRPDAENLEKKKTSKLVHIKMKKSMTKMKKTTNRNIKATTTNYSKYNTAAMNGTEKTLGKKNQQSQP